MIRGDLQLAYCMLLQKMIGRVSRDIAMVGSITSVNIAIAAPGRPIPKPLITPAKKNTTKIMYDSIIFGWHRKLATQIQLMSSWSLILCILPDGPFANHPENRRDLSLVGANAISANVRNSDSLTVWPRLRRTASTVDRNHCIREERLPLQGRHDVPARPHQFPWEQLPRP